MKVYRVENAEGEGPFFHHEHDVNFRSDDYQLWKDFMNDMDSCVHPAPSYNMIGEGKVFGCPSLENIRSWFPKIIAYLLHRYGYAISVYNVKTAFHHDYNDNQLSFKVKNAIKLETISLNSIYP